MEPSTIFKQACLLQLTTKAWPGIKKLDPATLMQIGDPEWVAGHKKLVERDMISEPKIIIAAARRSISALSCPFPIDGLNLINKNLIETAEINLTQAKNTFDAAVRHIAQNYANIIERSRQILTPLGLFSELDYPDDISVKYDFTWRYVMIETPGKHSILTPEIYAREERKFMQMMEDARDQTALALRQELKQLVTHMVERLSPSEDGREKVFRDTLVTNFTEFFNTFRERNLFGDAELQEIVSQAQEVLKGITPFHLRASDVWRHEVHTEMEKLHDIVTASITNRPMRKLRIEPREKEAA